MADRRKRNPLDRGGEWFVDATCIDCDLARLLAPGLIAEDGTGRSFFLRAPTTDAEALAASRALLACPTASIGAAASELRPDAFPFEVAPGVHHLGFSSPDSFGASAWLVERREGNLLVDGPRRSARVSDALRSRGGVRHVLLTHRDDVADAPAYAKKFGARMWIHEADGDAAPAADTFEDVAEIAPGVRAIPLPGHTRGSASYLVDDRFLFTGDSLYWSREIGDLSAFRGATWYSWEAQTESLARLAATEFEWVLPGHGGWGRDEPARMRERLVRLVERMRRGEVRDAW